MHVLARLSVILFVFPLVGCTRCSGNDLPGPADVAPAAGAAGTATSGEQATDLTTVLPRQIPAGAVPDGTWTIEFSLERIAGDENLDWSAAIAHCLEKGKDLCLETQWQRACERDAAIGKVESWTLTADHTGAAVRGGAYGCRTRSFHQIDEKSPKRIGLCCDRGVAIRSDDKSDEFRSAAAKRVLEFESALRAPTSEALGKLFAERVALDGNELDRDAALAKLAEERRGDPDRLVFFDHCNVKLATTDATSPLIADCSVILRSLGKTRGFVQRIAFASPTGPVSYLGDPRAMKPKEQKERVREFLPSE